MKEGGGGETPGSPAADAQPLSPGNPLQGPEAQQAAAWAAATLPRGAASTRPPPGSPRTPPPTGPSPGPTAPPRASRQPSSGGVNDGSIQEAQPPIQSFITSDSCVSMKFPVSEPFLLKTPTVTVSVSQGGCPQIQ